MATKQREILDAVLARLRAAPAIVPNPTDRVRLSHRTPPDRPDVPCIYIVPASDGLRGASKDCDQRELVFRVQVYGRSDGGVAAIDVLLEAVMARLRPARDHAIPYPATVRMIHGGITFEEELADKDDAFAELTFTASYSVPEWTL